MLSDDAYKRANERAIAFPIFVKEPVAKDEIAIYNRQIKGITTNSDALRVIKDVQPYHARDRATDQPLAIVHDLNRIDKHQNIVVVVGTFNMGMKFPAAVVIGSSKMSEEQFAALFQQKVEIKLARQVAFKRFGQRENQTAIPSLTHLLNAVRDVVKLFDS